MVGQEAAMDQGAMPNLVMEVMENEQHAKKVTILQYFSCRTFHYDVFKYPLLYIPT